MIIAPLQFMSISLPFIVLLPTVIIPSWFIMIISQFSSGTPKLCSVRWLFSYHPLSLSIKSIHSTLKYTSLLSLCVTRAILSWRGNGNCCIRICKSSIFLTGSSKYMLQSQCPCKSLHTVPSLSPYSCGFDNFDLIAHCCSVDKNLFRRAAWDSLKLL